MSFYALAQQCSPHFEEKQVMAAVADTESKFNPFAIGVVGGYVRQPTNREQAIMTVRELQKNGRNFSVGIVQVNQSNFARYGLNESNMFDLCTNLRVGSSIFRNCFDMATKRFASQYSYDGRLRLAASCYYSGNFKTGFKADFKGQPPYVVKFYNNLSKYRGKPTPAPVSNISNLSMQAQVVPQQAVTNAQSTGNSYASIVEAINEQKKQIEQSTDSSPQTQTDTENLQAVGTKKFNSWDIFQEF